LRATIRPKISWPERAKSWQRLRGSTLQRARLART
jgi:hypothetical protein